MHSLLSLAILIMVISAGSALVCSFRDKKYGEIVPISCFVLIFTELLLGVFASLKIGLIFVLVMAIGCYVIAIITNVKNKSFKKTFKRIITPGFVFFAFCCGLFVYINHGKYFSNWDEFSHWGDVVRAMVALDDFGTNPNSLCMFKSYPPAMSIFEYFLERIDQFIQPGKFNEPLAYCAWQILMVSFFLPFVERIGEKNKLSSIICGLVFLLSPLMVFSGVYYSTYIDPFLGIISGVGFAIIFFIDDEVLYKSLLVGSVAGVLVISKESGMLFAALIVLAYTMKLMLRWKSKELLYALIPIGCLIVPKFLWEYELKVSHVYKEFGGSIDFGELLRIISGKSEGYRSLVWNKFFEWFAGKAINWGRFKIPLSFLWLWIVTLFVIVVTLVFLIKTKEVDKSSIIISTLVLNLVVAFFVVGTVVSYMYKFSEYEAKNLASFYRYMNTVFLMVFVYMVCMFTYVIVHLKKLAPIGALVVLIVAVMMVPKFEINVELSRFAAEKSLWGIDDLHRLADYTNEVCSGNGNICFIAQEDNGFYKLVYTSLVKPNRVYPYWSIGKPFYEGDVYTFEIDSNAWREMLKNEYDYVELYKLNDYFYDNYSDAFSNPNEIAEGCFYRVNKETGLLEKVF